MATLLELLSSNRVVGAPQVTFQALRARKQAALNRRPVLNNRVAGAAQHGTLPRKQSGFATWNFFNIRRQLFAGTLGRVEKLPGTFRRGRVIIQRTMGCTAQGDER
jgi:hypothetical protein